MMDRAVVREKAEAREDRKKGTDRGNKHLGKSCYRSQTEIKRKQTRRCIQSVNVKSMAVYE